MSDLTPAMADPGYGPDPGYVCLNVRPDPGYVTPAM
jgi:hypothetical protein